MSLQELIPQTLPLRGIKLIEASAGTGKTWTIAALYTRLILGHRESGFDDPLTPDQILVVTFTDAATSELRDRIRARLADAASYLSNDASGISDDFLKELTNGLGPDDRRTLAHRLTIAADAMDDAAIYTIHGWCSRMLRQHAFDSGAPFELKIEGEEVELLNESVRDFWRTFFYPLSPGECRLISGTAKSPEDLLRKIRPLLKETEQTLEMLKAFSVMNPAEFRAQLQDLAKIDQAARQAEEAARTVWSRDIEDIENVILTASKLGHLNGNSYRQLEDRLKSFNAWSQGKVSIENVKWISLFSEEGFKLTKAAKNIEPEHPVFALMADWSEHLMGIESLSEELHNRILCSAAFWIRKDFSAAKSQKARLDYNDLILKLHESLVRDDNQRLAEIIREQYPVALIDEFQDTDPQQYEIFETIYGQGNGDTAWLMVGDPKQAIYGFRGADVYAYLRARRQGDAFGDGQGGTYTLPRNFRSTEALINATNHLFAQAERDLPRGAFNFPKETGTHDRIGFSSVRAQGRPERLIIEGQKADALTFWLDANEGEPLPQKQYRKIMANQCADEIVRLLNLGGMEPPGAFFEEASKPPQRLQESDIAILVRDGKEATAIRDALSLRGLRSVYLSDRDSVYESIEAHDLLIWLRACLNPQNGRLIRAAMATKTMGLEYSDLEHLNRDEFSLDQRIAEFTGYGHLWRSHGILPAIHHIILEQKLPERLMRRSTGERTLTNLLHLAELLQTESGLRDGENGLLRFLQESIADELQSAKDNVLRLESDQSLIRVVTIHKSKGLEYPLVFLPFVCSYKETRTQNLSAYRYHVQDDPQHPFTLELVKGCTDKNAALVAMELERLQEELRLLYVAITRARHACWLGIAPLKIGNNKESTLHKGAMGYLLSGDQVIPASELRGRIEHCMKGLDAVRIIDITPAEPLRYEGQSLNEVTEKEELFFKGKGFESWWIASYSALKFSKGGTAPSGPYAVDDEPETAMEDQSNEEEADTDATHAIHFERGQKGEGIHAFPAGAKHGVFLHELLESAAKIGFDVMANDASARDRLIDGMTSSRNYGLWNDTLKSWLPAFIGCRFKGDHQTLSLSEISTSDCLTEMEFWFEAKEVWSQKLDGLFKKFALPGKDRPSLNPTKLSGVLKGFIDLVFRHEGKYYVADYKSNWLGSDAQAYTESAIQEALLSKRYDAQYVLYLLALHRYLESRLGDRYDYDRDVGGAVYFFLRGVGGPVGGVHFEKPPLEGIERLDQLFKGTPKKEVHHAGE